MIVAFAIRDVAIRASDVVDVLGTAVLFYYLMLLIRGTRAVPIIVGIALLGLLLAVARIAHLVVLATVLQFALLGTAVTLPIVFQPELRRFLEQLGRRSMLRPVERGAGDRPTLEVAIAELARAATTLSRARIGALVAIEVTTGLREFTESGTRLDARLSSELVLAIFTPRSPLHDGAVVVRGLVLEAAGCFLPLSENVDVASHLGTRHRAAIGLSEQTDAVVLVISEQTGAISVARGGTLSRPIDDEVRLRSVLLACARPRRGGRRAARRPPPARREKPGVARV